MFFQENLQCILDVPVRDSGGDPPAEDLAAASCCFSMSTLVSIVRCVSRGWGVVTPLVTLYMNQKKSFFRRVVSCNIFKE